MNHFWILPIMRLPEKLGSFPTLLVLLALAGADSFRCSSVTTSPTANDVQHVSHADPLEGRAGDVVALVFTSTDCPVANAMAPQLGRSLKTLDDHGIRCYLVYPRSDVTRAMMAGHAEDYGLDARLVADRDRLLAGALGADVTPQGYVLEFVDDDEWRVRYRGRVNDLYASIGNRRDLATRHDWRDSALSVNEGVAIPVEGPPAVGCLIEIEP